MHQPRTLTIPTRLVFDASGAWLCRDDVHLPAGWDPREVVLTGRKHGCTTEDIYGCLFFHVKAQYRAFARRIRSMHVEIHVSTREASDLAQLLTNGRYAPFDSSVRFDRVETSNIMDYASSGPERIMQNWAPLLNRSNPHAALLMHTLNWGFLAPGGSVTSMMNSLDPRGVIRKLNIPRLLRLLNEYSVRSHFVSSCCLTLTRGDGRVSTYQHLEIRG